MMLDSDIFRRHNARRTTHKGRGVGGKGHLMVVETVATRRQVRE